MHIMWGKKYNLFSRLFLALQDDSGVVEASITKPSQETSVVNPSDVFGKQSAFVTPSSLPPEVAGVSTN